MNKRFRPILLLCLVLLISFVVIIPTAMAQESDFTESFDSETLERWERTEQAIVKDGALYISPDNLAIINGDYLPSSIEVKLKFDGSGVVFIRFCMREESDYALIFFEDNIVLEKVTTGTPEELGSSGSSLDSTDWVTITITNDQGQFSVSIDDEIIINATDDAPHPGGSFGFFVGGQSTAIFDDLKVSYSPSGALAEDVIAEDEADENTVTEDAESNDEGNLSQSTETANTETSTTSISDFMANLSGSQANQFELSTFVINLALSVLLSFILSRVYVHWGSSLSNRRRFASNFILITVTTTFIILVVRSSVALSLGLVGALSIIRFRAAIKEPEELAYLFFAISIGIGLGDNQRIITIMALAVAIISMGILRFFRGRQADFNLNVTISSQNPEKIDLETIMDTLSPHCSQLKLMRFDDSKTSIESSFLAEFKNLDKLKSAKASLRALSETLEITFLDNKGIW